MKIKTLLLSIAAALTISSVSVAQDQEQGSMQAQEQQRMAQMQGDQESTELDESTLNNFVDAMHEVNIISDEYTGKMAESEDPEEQQNLQVEAQDKMISVLEKNDISPQEYQSIVQLTQNNPQVREQVVKLYEEKADKM